MMKNERIFTKVMLFTVVKKVKIKVTMTTTFVAAVYKISNKMINNTTSTTVNRLQT